MPDSNKNQTPEPIPSGGEVRDRTSRPAGLLPKNTQTYVILGITVVMVGAIAFSGGNGTQSRKTASNEQKTFAAIDPNLARIQEYRNRIDEQARKLAAEQAQLEQTKQALGLPPASQAAAAQTPQTPTMAYAVPGYPQPTYTQQPAKPEKSAIEVEKEKREYQSLFASNVALSYRKDAVDSEVTRTDHAAVQPGTPSQAPALYPWPYPTTAATPATAGQPSLERTQAKAPARELAGDTIAREHHGIDASLQQAVGKQHRLFEGTLIETVLTNRLDGSFSGPVNCLVTTDVYSHDLQHLLIPKGSRVLGEVKRNDSLGQQRLAVSFHRLIMPDGYSVSLDQFTGLNQIGETGLRDKVNHHYAQVFGVSLAIGAIAGLANVNTGYGADSSSMDAYRQGVASSLSQSSLRILDRYLNILPTFTIREGMRVKVILTGDLTLPDYARHTMPSDL
ncbi:MAG: TrbI/VirB10 family protein [Acidobacteriales bacterium]|nr:TrbI/VirB10 family protein [Terriglobales bacterium]